MNAPARDISPHEFSPLSSLGPFSPVLYGGLGAAAQDPLTLRQAIHEALRQSPEAAIARAGNREAALWGAGFSCCTFIVPLKVTCHTLLSALE